MKGFKVPLSFRVIQGSVLAGGGAVFLKMMFPHEAEVSSDVHSSNDEASLLITEYAVWSCGLCHTNSKNMQSEQF